MSSYVSSLFAAANAGGIPWQLHLFVGLAVVIVAFLLGGYLGRKLRMPDHGWKIGIILFSLFAPLAVLTMGPPMKLGIDLKGGVLLVYEVDKSKQTSDQQVDMDKMIAAISKRINPGGQKEVTVRTYGTDQIEIIVPEVDEAEVQRIERTISRTGSLEFRILANRRDNADLMERALADPTKDKVLDGANKLQAWWVPVKEGQEHSFDSYSDIARREKMKGGRKVTEILVLNDPYNITGDYLTSAKPSTDRTGRPAVSFAFDTRGAERFAQMTSTHLPDKVSGFTYKLAIILDDELFSAPSIQSTISDQGEITGSFTPQEVQEQVNVLNAGSLPAALSKEPISKLYSGATLGTDTIEKSTRAMVVSSILVLLFMLWYYRFSGIVANIALGLNLLILFAVMIAFKAAFTLTGFAGLALTVGMAVDNNVLVYERLREELARGATVRMAIRNAFHRAGTTIIDCNVTHLIAATVLYVVGTDQLRGFALTLWIGVVTSMYTAVFVSHVLFEIAEKRQWLTKVKMMHLIGHTNINFMRLAPYCVGGSLIISALAIGISIQRGQSLFDIDFTGGISVQALFNEPQDTAKVRQLLQDRLPDLAISDVRVQNEQAGLRFDINTSERDMDKVKQELEAVFGKSLAKNAVAIQGPSLIASPKLPVEKETVEPKAAEPKKDAQSRNDLPSNSLLAFAGDEALAVALADQPAKTTADAPIASKSEEKPAPQKPAEATKKAPVVEKPALTDPYAGGYQATMAFKLSLDELAVRQTLETAMEAVQLDPKKVDFLLYPADEKEAGKSHKQWVVKMKLPQDQAQALVTTLQQQVSSSPIFPASSEIGAEVAGHTQHLAIYALIASWAGIILYLWLRFQGVAFGLAAVAALIHDVLMMLGAIALSIYVAPFLPAFLQVEPFKINLPIVAAFLTIIGYSVNDTIVVFDRIREVRGKDPRLTSQMINDSTNQTLSRTLLTSVTVALVVIVLYFFGGEALHGFAFALVIGVITGTYSSIYIAAPILMWLVGKHKEEAA